MSATAVFQEATAATMGSCRAGALHRRNFGCPQSTPGAVVAVAAGSDFADDEGAFYLINRAMQAQTGLWSGNGDADDLHVSNGSGLLGAIRSHVAAAAATGGGGGGGGLSSDLARTLSLLTATKSVDDLAVELGALSVTDDGPVPEAYSNKVFGSSCKQQQQQQNHGVAIPVVNHVSSYDDPGFRRRRQGNNFRNKRGFVSSPSSASSPRSPFSLLSPISPPYVPVNRDNECARHTFFSNHPSACYHLQVADEQQQQQQRVGFSSRSPLSFSPFSPSSLVSSSPSSPSSLQQQHGLPTNHHQRHRLSSLSPELVLHYPPPPPPAHHSLPPPPPQQQQQQFSNGQGRHYWSATPATGIPVPVPSEGKSEGGGGVFFVSSSPSSPSSSSPSPPASPSSISSLSPPPQEIYIDQLRNISYPHQNQLHRHYHQHHHNHSRYHAHHHGAVLLPSIPPSVLVPSPSDQQQQQQQHRNQREEQSIDELSNGYWSQYTTLHQAASSRVAGSPSSPPPPPPTSCRSPSAPQRQQQQQQQQQHQSTSSSLQLLGQDFGRRRSTRVVSKQHFGRQNSNLGRHSLNAEEAAQELARAGRNGALIVRTLDQWGDKMNGLEDFSYLLRFLGNRTQSASITLCAFDWMVSHHEGIKKDRCKLASTMISILGRLGRVDMAAQVFERMQEVGKEDSVYTYTALLSAYGRSGMYKEAVDLFQTMKDQGLKPNLVTYNTVIDACGKGGAGLQKALELFHQMRQEGICPDRITYNSLIAVCSRGGHWQEAHHVFQEMKRNGIDQDNFTFNTLIDALCKAGQMDFAAEVMGLMTEPNVVTYSTMIDGYGKIGQAAEAMLLFENMTASGILPDRITYNTLLDIYGKAGDLEHALAVFKEMEALGFQTDTVTYNALIDAYGKQGLFREAAQLFDEMQSRGLRPNVLTYSALIGAYAKVGMHAEAVSKFEEMKRMGLKPDVVLYSTLVDVYGKNGLVEEATALVKEMAMAGIEPNVVTFNSLIDAYGRRGQVDRALRTLEQLCGSSSFLVADASTCARVISAYSREGRKEDALALLSKIHESDIGFSPEYAALSTLMDDGDEHVMATLQVVQEMQEAGVKPNVVTFSALLSFCSKFSSWQEASRLLDGVRRCEPLVYGVAHGLLKGDDQGVWQRASRLFDQIGSTDSDTRKAFYNALVDLLWRFGQKQGARRVILEALKRQVFDDAVVKVNDRTVENLDLHLMSVGTAQAMLHVWLSALRLDAINGLDLPRQLSILTGWGKHSKIGDSIVKRAVEAVLEGMGSPFKVPEWNEGRVIACGQAVKDWLLSTRTELMLELKDERVLKTHSTHITFPFL